MVEIRPDASGRITVSFPYDPEVVARLRTVKTRKWHGTPRGNIGVLSTRNRFLMKFFQSSLDKKSISTHL